MSVVSQELPNLLGGVSQQPVTERDASEGEEQINCLSFIAGGLTKRPASQHTSVLSDIASNAYDSVHVHPVARNSTDRYRIILSNGDLKVFDAATGAKQTVVFPNGKVYLNTTDPARDLRCVTIGEYTYVTNKTVVVAKSTIKSAIAKNEALISIRAADFATRYTVTIDSTTVDYQTPTGADPNSRADIGTEKIAEKLRTLLLAAFPTFAITQYGSTLYIRRVDDGAFSISAGDGLADEGIKAIKGSVQRFDDLPDRAKNGFIVEVTGDPTNLFDNYFVEYNDNGSPNLAGVWKETVKPGILTSLDASTMPHQLVRGAALYDGIEASSIAAPPVIKPSLPTKIASGWEKTTYPGCAAPNQANPEDFNSHGESMSAALEELDGSQCTVRVHYNTSTWRLYAEDYVTVEMALSNAPSTSCVAPAGYTVVASRKYKGGANNRDEVLQAITSLPANTRVQLMLKYSQGFTPVGNHVSITPWGYPDADHPSIEVIKNVAREVRFDANGLFPATCITTLTVGTTPYAHTSTVDETGAVVALALKNLVTTPYTAVMDGDGVIVITQAGNNLPTATVGTSFDSTKVLYSPALSLTVNALVGQTVENISDGSTGVVASNTATTITVTALTGGATNKFSRGDVCTVTSTGTNYVFGNALWKSRKVGDITTIPFPSIVGKKVGELLFTKNRLGLLAQGNVVLSQSGDNLNLFRQTATDLLPDDVVDVKSTKLADFHSATDWDETMLLWTSDGQVVLSGGETMTPETVKLDVKTKFINSTRLRPVVAGNKMFFARGMGSSTHVFEYSIVDQTGSADADNITKYQPTYIKGTPIQMAVDSSRGFLALLTDDDQSKLYVYCYHYASQTRVQNAWSRWEFAPGTRIVSIDIIDGKLGMIVSRPNGVYLETIDLDPSAV